MYGLKIGFITNLRVDRDVIKQAVKQVQDMQDRPVKLLLEAPRILPETFFNVPCRRSD